MGFRGYVRQMVLSGLKSWGLSRNNPYRNIMVFMPRWARACFFFAPFRGFIAFPDYPVIPDEMAKKGGGGDRLRHQRETRTLNTCSFDFSLLYSAETDPGQIQPIFMMRELKDSDAGVVAGRLGASQAFFTGLVTGISTGKDYQTFAHRPVLTVAGYTNGGAKAR